MPRVARNIIADIPYHIVHRGNNRQKIFFSESSYKYFLSLLREAKKKHPCKIYSYALMSSHIHLLLEAFKQAENLAKFMKLIAQKYAQFINKSHKRTGTLWEGRFKSLPVSSDNYLLACSRYIELNPVRVALVKNPEDYKWSSHRFKIGNKEKEPLLDSDPIYAGLGKDEIERQKNYKSWFKESIPAEEWELIKNAVNKGGVFGNDKFKAKLEKLLGRKLDTRKRGRPKKNKK